MFDLIFIHKDKTMMKNLSAKILFLNNFYLSSISANTNIGKLIIVNLILFLVALFLSSL